MASTPRQLGRFLADHRAARGLTLVQVADQVGVSKSTVHKWELGESIPKGRVMEPLAQALGVSYEDLFAEAGFAHPEGLPTFQPYLRAKYGALPDEALAEAEAFFDELTTRYEEDGDAESDH